jgi:hypothetical protein
MSALPRTPLRSRTTPALDRERSRSRSTAWWIEVLAASVVAVVYLAAPRSTPSTEVILAAERRGAALFGWERSWNVAIEPAVQSAVAAIHLEWVANWLYGSLHFVVTATAFVVLMRRRPADYPRWRTTFVLASLTAFALHHWLPVAPPRLVPDGRGSTLMSDWLAEHATPWSFESGPISEVANHYSAMPSMHVGWAVLSAIALASMLPRRCRRIVLVGYPLLVTVVVMATGNHFLLDAVAGALVGLGAWWAVPVAAHLAQWWRHRRTRGRHGRDDAARLDRLAAPVHEASSAGAAASQAG